jgi:monoamine oxidase
MGPVVRVVLRFARPDAGHWSRPGARGFDFLHVEGAAFSPLWRATGPGEPPVVTAWAGGPAASRLPAADDQRLRAAVASLARGLGLRPAAVLQDLAGWRIFDWDSDPFSRGGYSFVAPGGRDLPAELAAPIDGTLFFAGEAAHTGGQTGTVHGALETAERAVREITARL